MRNRLGRPASIYLKMQFNFLKHFFYKKVPILDSTSRLVRDSSSSKGSSRIAQLQIQNRIVLFIHDHVDHHHLLQWPEIGCFKIIVLSRGNEW